MTLRALPRVGLPAALFVLLCGPARAAVDMSGHFIGTLQVSTTSAACTTDITQSGSAITITANCPSLNVTSSASGTIDPSTGDYSATGSSSMFCTTPGSLIVNGMGASDSYSFRGTFTCGAFSGSAEGSRCGNGVLDAGEDQSCDDAVAAAFASAGGMTLARTGPHCCNSHCQFLPSGTPCASFVSFGSGPCDVPGFCTGSSPICPVLKQPDGTPCDDGNPCTTNTTCSAGSCTGGTPAPAGTTCLGAAAACRSSCRQQLVECKRTCARSGQTRRKCRAACTAPGARIRTLAYVVTECRQDPQGFFSSRQKLLVRRGNCDPVTLKEFAGGPPRPEPLGLCRTYGEGRQGALARASGRFQRLAVLPDGSGVVFEVTNQFPVSPGPPSPEEGIFFVRANGRHLRPLGPASRAPISSTDLFPVSPDGRKIALIDLGPDAAGHEAPQIFLLDLRSGGRCQLTHQSEPTICCQQFLNNRTVTYHRSEAFRVKTNCKRPDEKEIPPPVLVQGARVVQQFTVTNASPQLLFVYFPDRPAVNGGLGVAEMFLFEGKNLLQLTNFGRSDTFWFGGFITRGRVLFPASANLRNGNLAEICQLFSIDTLGADLRQLTHLPSDGRPGNGCVGGGTGCAISAFFLDRITGTVLLASSCDPVGANPFGEQLFAMRPDGTGLRQLTNARGMTTDPDGTIHVELPGPYAYTSPGPGG